MVRVAFDQAVRWRAFAGARSALSSSLQGLVHPSRSHGWTDDTTIPDWFDGWEKVRRERLKLRNRTLRHQALIGSGTEGLVGRGRRAKA
jgi:hypothetical protein